VQALKQPKCEALHQARLKATRQASAQARAKPKGEPFPLWPLGGPGSCATETEPVRAEHPIFSLLEVSENQSVTGKMNFAETRNRHFAPERIICK